MRLYFAVLAFVACTLPDSTGPVLVLAASDSAYATPFAPSNPPCPAGFWKWSVQEVDTRGHSTWSFLCLPAGAWPGGFQ